MENVQRCCHSECLAGCYGSGANACVACKGALHQGVCVPHCPSGTYLYKGRRCVTATECFNISMARMLTSPPMSSLPSSQSTSSLPRVPKFAIHQGACVSDCPTAHQRDNVTGHCQACGNKCPSIRTLFATMLIFSHFSYASSGFEA